MGYYFFAETAFHHEGDIEYLKDLIEGVAETGVDGIKFQVLINPEDFIVSHHSAYGTVLNWLFDIDQWGDLFTHTLKHNLDIIMMPLDRAAFELIPQFPVRYLELHSVSFNDQIVVDQLSVSGLPVILGAGGRTLEEIDGKLTLFPNHPPVLMTGFQAFPSDLKDVRLPRISNLSEKYPDCSLGYADHTSYENPYALSSLEFAYLLGARYFEKHVTLNEGQKRTDYEAAVGLPKLKEIKDRLDFLSTILNDEHSDVWEMSEPEMRYRNRQKFAVAGRALQGGTKLTADDLKLKITESQNGFNNIGNLVGEVLKSSVAADSIIEQDNIE